MVVSRLAEDDDVGRVEMHGHHVQLSFQLAEVVGSSADGEGLGEEAFKGSVVKEAGGQNRSEGGEQAEKGDVARIEGIVAERRRKGARQTAQTAGKLAHGGTKENLGFKVKAWVPSVRNDGATEIVGGYPVGEHRADQPTRADTNLHI